MRTITRSALFCVVLVYLIGLPSADAAALLEEKRAIYISEMAKIQSITGGHLEKLQKQYADQLQTLRATVQAAGQLDALVAVNKEIERFEKTKTLSKEDLSDNQTLAAAQQSQLEALDALPAARAARIVTLADQYMRLLEKLQIKLTQENKLDDAMAIKAEHETIRTSKEVTAARDLHEKTLQAKRAKEVQTPVAVAQPEKDPADDSNRRTLDRMLGRVNKGQTESHIRKRFEKMCDEMLDDKWDAVANYVDPAFIKQHGTQGLKFRMGLVVVFLRMTQDKRVKLAVDSVEINEEGDAAELTPKLWANNTWRPLKPVPWIKCEDEWYVKMSQNAGDGGLQPPEEKDGNDRKPHAPARKRHNNPPRRRW